MICSELKMDIADALCQKPVSYYRMTARHKLILLFRLCLSYAFIWCYNVPVSRKEGK